MKAKESTKKKLLVLIGTILCLVLITVAFVLNNEQDIEQYYIEGSHMGKRLDVGLEDENILYYEEYKVIKNYSDYIKIFADDSEVITLLQNTVNENFFNSKLLIVLNDTTPSAGGISGHISKVNIKNNIASITIKRDSSEYGDVVPYYRTYFVPVENKNITGASIEKEIPYDFDSIREYIEVKSWDFRYSCALLWIMGWFVIVLFMLIVPGIAIIKFVRTRKKIKKALMDDERKKAELKKAIIIMIAYIVIWIYCIIYMATSGNS